MDFAITAWVCGAQILSSFTRQTVLHKVLGASAARVVVVGANALYQRRVGLSIQYKDSGPRLVFTMDGPDAPISDVATGLRRFEDFLSLGTLPQEETIHPDDTAVLCYTSGKTGPIV
ncbi:hypothetical protein BDZ89DRAFT_1161584 [Hymenopellis radicata]|nr:hypothetical protein BDZ89DRAFT_1161584 [Hymenopellis radicata]